MHINIFGNILLHFIFNIVNIVNILSIVREDRVLALHVAYLGSSHMVLQEWSPNTNPEVTSEHCNYIR